MSTYRKSWELVVDGESFKVTTNGQDMANAERMAARDGYSVADGGAIATQQRLAYIGFRRANPGHRLAHAFGDFIAVLDDITDLDADNNDSEAGLDPIQSAATAD
jgi:hypothetical protein